MKDLVLVRADIPEPARYYHADRAIVIRQGLKLEDERRYLWHELVHAERGDTACSGWFADAQERSVEREAAHRAMPLVVMEERLQVASDWHDFVWHMKVPERWVRFRLTIAHPAETALLQRACRWAEADQHTA